MARDLPYAVGVGAPFQKLFGLNRSVQYLLIEAAHVESFVVGEGRGRRFIVVDSYLAYIARQQEREAARRARNNGHLGCGWLSDKPLKEKSGG